MLCRSPVSPPFHLRLRCLHHHPTTTTSIVLVGTDALAEAEATCPLGAQSQAPSSSLCAKNLERCSLPTLRGQGGAGDRHPPPPGCSTNGGGKEDEGSREEIAISR
jgi:hypothetical protein